MRFEFSNNRFKRIQITPPPEPIGSDESFTGAAKSPFLSGRILSIKFSPKRSSTPEKSQVKQNNPQAPKEQSPGVVKPLLLSATNPGVLAGIGSTIVTCVSEPVPSFAFGAITCLAFFNTFRSAISRNDPHVSNQSQESTEQPQKTRIGFKGLASEIVKSPGVFSAFQSAVYFWTAGCELAQGRGLEAAAFGLMGVGVISVYHLCNIGHKHADRNPLPIEETISKRFYSLSKNAQNVLKNPGIYFPPANLLLIACAKEFATMPPAAHIMFGVSCAISTAGVLGGLAPLVSKYSMKESGFSMMMAAANDFMLGISSLMGGFNVTGLATLFWGGSGLSGGISTELRTRKEVLTNKSS